MAGTSAGARKRIARARSRRDVRVWREMRAVRAAYPELVGSPMYEPAMTRLAVLRVQHRALELFVYASGGESAQTLGSLEVCRRLSDSATKLELYFAREARAQRLAERPATIVEQWARQVMARREQRAALTEEEQAAAEEQRQQLVADRPRLARDS